MSRNVTAKHRLFAKNLADGMTQAEAYTKAGFRAKDAASCASALLKKNPTILNWRDEYIGQKQQVEQAALNQAITAKRITLEGFIDDLMKIKEMGMAATPVLDPKGNPIGEYRADLGQAREAIRMLGQELFGAFIQKSQAVKPAIENITDEELVAKAQAAAERMGVKLPKLPTLQ